MHNLNVCLPSNLITSHWPSLTRLNRAEWNICPSDHSKQEMSQSPAASYVHNQDHSQFPLPWMALFTMSPSHCLAGGHTEMRLEKLVTCIQVEGERVAHKSLDVINIPVTEEAAITACVTCGCSELTKPGKEKFGQHQPAVKEAEETEKRETVNFEWEVWTQSRCM